jgi:hypothetical protein
MRVALLVALLALPAVAKEREGVVAPPTIEAGGKTLHLMGMGLRKKFIFKVYLASLYVENPIPDSQQLLNSDQIKRVEMHMLRDLERGKIIEAVQEGFEKNNAPEMPRLQARLDRFLKTIPDLKSGQTIVITYYPSRGTVIKAGNGEEIAIDGKDFADALFSVWLGNHPVDDDLKGEMMSNNK